MVLQVNVRRPFYGITGTTEKCPLSASWERLKASTYPGKQHPMCHFYLINPLISKKNGPAAWTAGDPPGLETGVV
ncbi:MAG: hypothetical protein DYH02_10160 [Candidatus Omnitrophica bacterium COP1]|nr:hypothetical protein [Candidatus Omnitrophica bacterium COP1]